MHKQAAAYRQAEALARLERHAQAIKERLGLPTELQTTPAQKARDPYVSDLLRIEALAEFLGAVNDALENKAEGQGQPPADASDDEKRAARNRGGKLK